MQPGAQLRRGQVVRLTSPYWDAERGLYTVEFIYRNGTLSVVSHTDGRRHEVPARICRPVDMNGGGRD